MTSWRRVAARACTRHTCAYTMQGASHCRVTSRLAHPHLMCCGFGLNLCMAEIISAGLMHVYWHNTISPCVIGGCMFIGYNSTTNKMRRHGHETGCKQVNVHVLSYCQAGCGRLLDLICSPNAFCMNRVISTPASMQTAETPARCC